MKDFNIKASIRGIKYDLYLCRDLKTWNIDEIENAFSSKKGSFLIKIDESDFIAISRWVSAKRTRSYPYTRVYDTLKYSGKKITIIPIFKDEGKRGDRDFLQWDTISLMSLLGVHVIIGYYIDASVNPRFKNKITNQIFNISYIKEKINEIINYQSGPLHWNLSQTDIVGEIGDRAISSYREISKRLKIEMHSFFGAKKRLSILSISREKFMKTSREFARKAQIRETMTTQPKESLSGAKARLTIKNFLGGEYYFTVDEAKIQNKNLFLIEGKHTKNDNLPTEDDIKDGLIKMILYSNLEEVFVNNAFYYGKPILKLTTGYGFSLSRLCDKDEVLLKLLTKEAESNNFKILINDSFI